MTNYDKYIESLKLKDEEAFAFIYHDTKALVYSIILGIVDDRSASEDLMQDTYLTMLEKINQYKSGTNFRSWLLAIARNKAIDYYRRKQKETFIEPEQADFILPRTNAVGERNLLISDILYSLSQIERTVFLLYIVDDLKHREIAEVLDLPLGTVLWHYNKATKKIKKIKGDENIGKKR
ncbi:MAG: RNA polymerase sigma factor [Bacilli bacterium]|nr:RNA polymerase sigma factor [Bacilli bacterium]